MNLGAYGVPRRPLPDVPVMASVSLSANQTVVDATETKIAFDTVDFDYAGLWDAPNQRFKIPIKGIWRYTILLQGQGATNTIGIQSSIRKNGVFLRYVGLIQYPAGTPGSATQICGTFNFQFSAGDYVEGYAWIIGNGTHTVTAGATVQQLELVRAV